MVASHDRFISIFNEVKFKILYEKTVITGPCRLFFYIGFNVCFTERCLLVTDGMITTL